MIGAFSWEIFLFLLQAVLCFAGVVVVVVAMAMKSGDVWQIGRFLFNAYSLLCIAQVGFLVRAVCRFVDRGVFQLGFSLWILCGVVCAIVGGVVFLKERKGVRFDRRLHLLLFLTLALVPWLVVAVGTHLKKLA